MTEKQISQEPQSHDPEYSRATKVAAGLLAGGLVLGVGATVERGIRENNRNEAISQENERKEAVLNEIDTKAGKLYIPEEESSESMVGYIPVIEGSSLYDSMLGFIPEDSAKNDFVQYTVLESSKAQGTYQPDESFGLFGDTIDGKQTYIVRQIDNSTANGYIEIPDSPANFATPEASPAPTVSAIPTPKTH